MDLKLSIAFIKTKKLLKERGFELKPHQEEGVKWMLKKELQSQYKGGLLCDDPGLGKTIQTAGLLAGNPVDKTLIIVPIALVNQWKDTLGKIFPDRVIYVHVGPNKVKTMNELYQQRFQICITTMGSIYTKGTKILDEMRTVLHSMKWDRVIIDECQYIRNSCTKLHIMCCELDATYHWGLSGTPVQNNKKDIINLFKFLGISSSICKEHLAVLIDVYFLRRNKSILYREDSTFKEYTVENHYCEFDTKEEQTIYQKTLKNAISEYFDALHNCDQQITLNAVLLELLLRLRQVSSHPNILFNSCKNKFKKEDRDKPVHFYDNTSTKMKKAVELVQEADGLCLVFCQFRMEMTMMQSYLSDKGIESDIYDGSLNMQQREDVLNKFKAKAKIVEKDGKRVLVKPRIPKVLLIQMKAGGVGLNLQQFNNIIILSADWNPSNEIQAIARAHRIGQNKEVMVHKLILVANEEFFKTEEDYFTTVDEHILNIQTKKRALMSQLLKDDTLAFNERPKGKYNRISKDDLVKMLTGNIH